MKSKIKELIKERNIQTSSQKENRSFAEDEEVKVNNLKGLKIDNSQSTVKAVAPRINIEEKAYEILKSNDLQTKLGWELTSKLLSIFKDKTLEENKDQQSRDYEKQVLQDYVSFAKLINSDETKEEGLGTLTFLIAISRCAIVQRNKINELEYEIHNLKKSLKHLYGELKFKKEA